MPYTVTVISTKPQGTEWWDAVQGSPDHIAREELFAWTAQQPGFISVTSEVTGPNNGKNVFVFDTEANYAAYNAAMVQQPAAITRAEYNSANGITFVATGVTT
jgi:hypothetical protein